MLLLWPSKRRSQANKPSQQQQRSDPFENARTVPRAANVRNRWKAYVKSDGSGSKLGGNFGSLADLTTNIVKSWKAECAPAQLSSNVTGGAK